ncbi:MAG: hypothetical protein N0C88_17240 [Candidatus Thiodiazotropha lotti]|uniref:Uncharacterized protein n=1 Tax=Candidatus Thiodiazotropha lotti TaxID=2792787 RepID=A0A9E4K891_9GAMM|nr:hypothetical protein [Candidatus Thiodiazotropha lotti]MCW4205048.1 hypothetical protein [Candidatus Thiodiazotropha lotti]
MINNIHTLKEKNPPDFVKDYKEDEWYVDEGDLCYDFGSGDFEFTLIFEGKSELFDIDKLILGQLLGEVVKLDSEVARKMKPYEDYEFELSYITIGKSVLFSYCGINVNSTWESEFNIEVGETCSFKSVF